MIGIFRELIKPSLLIPEIILNTDLCILSVYDTAHSIYLFIEYLYNDEQQCACYDIDKYDELIESACFSLTNDRKAKYHLAFRLEQIKNEAEQSNEQWIDKTKLNTFFKTLFQDNTMTLQTIIENRLTNIHSTFTIHHLEEAFKAIGNLIKFKITTESSCCIS